MSAAQPAGHASITIWDMVQGEDRQITIAAGQTMTDSHRQETDEGWESLSVVWSFDGERLLRIVDTDGVDCDGRLSRHYEQTTTVAEAEGGWQDEEGRRWPSWTDVPRAARQRDYAAEAAGY